MGLKRPPQHRVDAKPIFVHPDDDAWDEDKIKAECDAMEAKQVGSSVDHPVARYRSGETRYDLTEALPYLDTEKAWQFELRPLEMEEFAEVQDLKSRFGEWRAYLHSGRAAMVKGRGQGCPQDFEAVKRTDKYLPIMLGQAAFIASLPPTDAEKKP